MTANFSITNRTKGNPPVKGLPFAAMKQAVLGKRYELSLVFVSNAESRKLNQIYREKTYTPNVLSFSLSPDSGEIFINPAVAAKEAPQFGRMPRKHIAALFIHGLYHLKGYDHGSTMEGAEAKTRKRFRI